MTYVTDPIGDMLTRIRNAQMANHKQCFVPWSGQKQNLCELLAREGWIKSAEVTEQNNKKSIKVIFAEEKANLDLQRISKPGRRVYTKVNELKPVLHGYGVAILTTSQGLMTDKQAKEKKLGGEIICNVS